MAAAACANEWCSAASPRDGPGSPAASFHHTGTDDAPPSFPSSFGENRSSSRHIQTMGDCPSPSHIHELFCVGLIRGKSFRLDAGFYTKEERIIVPSSGTRWKSFMVWMIFSIEPGTMRDWSVSSIRSRNEPSFFFANR